MPLDPDNLDPRLIEQLAKMYESSAARLRAIVLNPPGKTASAQAFNQARAASALNQVEAEVARIKKTAAEWTGKALKDATAKGVKVADAQVKLILPDGGHGADHFVAPRDPFSGVDHETVRILARDTLGDLTKAADSMGRTSGGLLRKMAATGVTNEQVNQILAGRYVIEGQPQQAIRELREALKKVHGDVVTITDKNGDPIEFKAGYYAELVARTKTSEAIHKAKCSRLADHGIDLVTIVGRISRHFCTQYLDKVFSISGRSKKYPALSSLPNGGPPFHPNCSKSTQPFIADLADDAALEAAEPDETTQKFLGTNDTTALQKAFRNSNLQQEVRTRTSTVANSILARAGGGAGGSSPGGST